MPNNEEQIDLPKMVAKRVEEGTVIDYREDTHELEDHIARCLSYLGDVDEEFLADEVKSWLRLYNLRPKHDRYEYKADLEMTLTKWMPHYMIILQKMILQEFKQSLEEERKACLIQ